MAYTEGLESAEEFRQWTAIGVIAAALEQKVWLTTTSRLYPNLYTLLVGHPGVGKTRTIMEGRKFLAELPGLHIAPTSMKMASLVDALAEAKRAPVSASNGSLTIETFNSMTLLADDLSAFMHAYDDELVAGLTVFYDVWPYEHRRRTTSIHIKIPRPQLNIITGTTPSDLLKCIPDGAWGQGFTSRIILVFSDQRTVLDDFAGRVGEGEEALSEDLAQIFALQGEFKTTEEFRKLVAIWRSENEQPRPSHPRLEHYCSRRRATVYKLAMVSSMDRSSELVLSGDDFRRALGWLGAAELNMPRIFEEGASTVDGRAMDEIADFVRRSGVDVPEHRIIRFASGIVPAHAVLKVLQLMAMGGRLLKTGEDTKGNPLFRVD